MQDFWNKEDIFQTQHLNRNVHEYFHFSADIWLKLNIIRGIRVVGDRVQGGLILSFQQLKTKVGITKNDFFKFLQVWNFILNKLKEFTGGFVVFVDRKYTA